MRKREIEAILKKVNQFRELRGLDQIDEIPKGRLSSPSSCPLAAALGNQDVYVGGSSIYTYSDEKANKLAKIFKRKENNRFYFVMPKYFKRFIERFDNNKEKKYEYHG